ncbi:MAG: glycosyltransferase family 39 protein [Chthoniobacterales bacterium]|nr:glycosyltransferase family 39 protein [Chthoniobacterales bacterium]
MGASDPILYQFYIWILHSLSFDNRLIVGLLTGLFSALMPWTFYRAAREFGMHKVPALVLFLLIAITPSLFTIYHYFMMETLLLPLLGMALWMTARHLRKKSLSSFATAVMFWMLACLTKATVVPLAALCLAWIWWESPRKLATAFTAIGIAAILLLPNSIRTYAQLGFVASFGNPWLTKIQHRSGARKIEIAFKGGEWGFVSPSCVIYPLAPLSKWTMRRALEDSTVKVDVDVKAGERDWKDSYQRLDVGWREWMSQWGENIVLFLFAPSWPDCNTNEWDGWLTVMSRWMWAPIIFFVLDCNIRDFYKRRFDLLPVATTVFTLFLMFQNVATSEGRYRKPLEPLLLMNLVWAITPRPKNAEESSSQFLMSHARNFTPRQI